MGDRGSGSAVSTIARMGLPDGYELRAPVPADLDAVAAVLAADDLDDAGQVVLDADFVRAAWSRADLDLGTDAWVVTNAVGTVVGYGQATPEESGAVESWGVVHPEHRERGIGSTLLDRIEERATELLAGHPEPRFRNAINAADHSAAALLRTRGLRAAHHFWHMQIDLGVDFDAGPPPDGIEITTVDPATDLPATYAILDATLRPFERWTGDLTENPGYDPSLWLLASDLDEPVGALISTRQGDRGWVDQLGVLDSHRGRGIGAALLRRSFAAFSRLGVHRVLLAVDAENPTGATALYERVGMRVVKRWDMWER